MFPTSVSVFLTWAWSAESGARSPPLWASGSGSSAAAAGCLWTRSSGCVSLGRFDWHSLDPLSARQRPWPGGLATPSWSGGHVGLMWRPLWQRGAEISIDELVHVLGGRQRPTFKIFYESKSIFFPVFFRDYAKRTSGRVFLSSWSLSTVTQRKYRGHNFILSKESFCFLFH